MDEIKSKETPLYIVLLAMRRQLITRLTGYRKAGQQARMSRQHWAMIYFKQMRQADLQMIRTIEALLDLKPYQDKETLHDLQKS